MRMMNPLANEERILKEAREFAKHGHVLITCEKRHLIALTEAGDLTPIGIHPMTAFSAILVVEVDERVCFGFYSYGEGKRKYFLRRLDEATPEWAEEPQAYFTLHGSRWYIGEFMAYN